MDDAGRIELLVAAAAQDSNGDSRVALFRALNGLELFYAANEIVVDGRTMMSTPLRQLNDNRSAMLVYTSKGHRALPQRFVGAQWLDLLKIAYGSVRPDLLVIIGRDNETVAITRDQLPIISADLLAPQRELPELRRQPPDGLEAAISNAVKEHSDNLYESALAQLRGRELYLHMADGTSEDAEPALVTSAAGGIDGWVLTYTTRTRPGIRYGGILWEELVKMIKNNAGMPGVRVVNNVDDWIVLGREVI